MQLTPKIINQPLMKPHRKHAFLCVPKAKITVACNHHDFTIDHSHIADARIFVVHPRSAHNPAVAANPIAAGVHPALWIMPKVIAIHVAVGNPH
jgi:hypothetical protein